MSNVRYIPAQAMSSKATFAAFLKDGSVAPYVSEEITRERWVWFGADNLAPERWAELADNCVPLGRCVDIASLFIAGAGVEFVDEEGNEIDAAQTRFQEWMSETGEEVFLHAVARDVALFNAFAADVVPLVGGRPVGRLRHRDVSRLRVGKPDTEGTIANYWWSFDWMAYRRRDRNKPMPLEVFRYTDNRSRLSTLYAKSYKAGKDFYGEPWWLPATADCEVWTKVPRYNATQMDTGFSPVVHLHLETERDEKDIDKLYEAVQQSYTGATGQGLFLTFGRSGENVQLTPLQRGDHAGELDAMRTAAEKVIVRSYGVPNVIYGMDEVKTGMDGAAAALEQAVTQFQRTFVEPRQKMITMHLAKLMERDGIDVWDCRIRPLNIIDAKVDAVQDRQAYIRTVTINEHRQTRLGMPELPDGDKLIVEAGAKEDLTQ
jgi:hypothetical protein